MKDQAAGRLVNAVDTEEAAGEPEREVGGLFLCALEAAARGGGARSPLPPPPARSAELHQVMKVGVDSCAGISVLPSTMCQDYPLESSAQSRAGVEYYPAGVNTSVKDLGNRTLSCNVEGSARRMRFHVCEVRKPLLAVSAMVDAGHDVHFSKDGSYAYHRGTQECTRISRENGIYVMEATVKPFSPINGKGHV